MDAPGAARVGGAQPFTAMARGPMVIWERDGVLYTVMADRDADTVLEIATSMY